MSKKFIDGSWEGDEECAAVCKSYAISIPKDTQETGWTLALALGLLERFGLFNSSKNAIISELKSEVLDDPNRVNMRLCRNFDFAQFVGRRSIKITPAYGMTKTVKYLDE